LSSHSAEKKKDKGRGKKAYQSESDSSLNDAIDSKNESVREVRLEQLEYLESINSFANLCLILISCVAKEGRSTPHRNRNRSQQKTASHNSVDEDNLVNSKGLETMHEHNNLFSYMSFSCFFYFL
jgi:hypothetical protein